MNYRHSFHAGNFADVFKHLVLLLVLQHLCRKPTPFFVLDTHAGRGFYRLDTPEAGRTREAEHGIGRLLTAAPTDGPLADLVALVRSLQDGPPALRNGAPLGYPGSPALAQSQLRLTDRLVLVELHPDDGAALRDRFCDDRRVAVHRMDGYQALKAHLPPVERRGLVLIDPPYERPDESEAVVQGLVAAHRRWPTGHYLIWFPIKDRAAVWRFEEALVATGLSRILVAELTVHPEDNAWRLNGCGMALVNPPWQIDRRLEAVLPDLQISLAQTGGGSRIAWLVPA